MRKIAKTLAVLALLYLVAIGVLAVLPTLMP